MRELVVDGIALNKAKANKLDLTSEGLELTTDKILSILDEEDQKENVDPEQNRLLLEELLSYHK